MNLVSGWAAIKCDLVGNTYLFTEFRRKGMLLIMFQNPLKWVSMEYTVLAVASAVTLFSLENVGVEQFST